MMYLSLQVLLVVWIASLGGFAQDADRVTVRLANTQNTTGASMEGRVEVYRNGQWGTICDADWTMKDARVVCSMAGYGTARTAVVDGRYGANDELPVLLDNVQCQGDEESLTNCSLLNWTNGSTQCNSSRTNDVGVICTNVRLAGSDSPKSGRVEVYYNGTWGSVCGSGFGYQGARVVCRELGYDFSLGTSSCSEHFIESEVSHSQTTWLTNVGCSGNEKSIFDCHNSGWGVPYGCYNKFYAKAICRDILVTPNRPIRLTNGTHTSNTTNGSLFYGSVETLVDGSWYTFCWDGWSIKQADIACKQLGFYGASDTYNINNVINGIFVTNTRFVIKKCHGNETALSQCPHTEICTRYSSVCNRYQLGVAGVICKRTSVPPPLSMFRLSNNSGFDFEGVVELNYNGTWGTICNDRGWNLASANVVCRMAGFIGATEVDSVCALGFCRNKYSEFILGAFTGPVWLSSLKCQGNESSIEQCGFDGPGARCNGGSVAKVTCDYRKLGAEVRLVGGSNTSNTTKGKVEIFLNNQWVSVSNSNWGHKEAMVVCNQLGFFGPATVVPGALFESSPTLSPPLPTPTQSTPAYSQSLLTPTNTLGSPTEFFSTLSESPSSPCSQSQSTQTISLQLSPSPSPLGLDIQPSFQCTGEEDYLSQCARNRSAHKTSQSNDIAGVMCSTGAYAIPIRLRDIRQESEGRVEIYIRKRWGTICGSSWTIEDAAVVCRQLGYAGVASNTTIFREKGSAVPPVVWSTAGCTGREDELVNCSGIRPYFNGDVDSYSCANESLVAGLKCIRAGEAPYKIWVPGGSRGLVHMDIHGVSGVICSNNFNLKTGQVLCRQLGYPATGDRVFHYFNQPSDGPVWLSDISCTGNELYITDCKNSGFDRFRRPQKCYSYTGVVCSKRYAFPLRLTNGTVETKSEGTVLIEDLNKRNEHPWGTICGDSWGVPEGQVACRMLGYSTLVQAYTTVFNDGRTQTLMSNVNCSGTETDLWRCSYNLTRQICHGNLVAAISCTNFTPRSSLRLVGGSGPHEGRLEISDATHSWGAVCYGALDMRDGKIACNQLGYANVERISDRDEFGRGTKKFWLDGVECSGFERSLEECVSNQGAPWGYQISCDRKKSYSNHDAGLVCANFTRTASLQLTHTQSTQPTIEFQPTSTISLTKFHLTLSKSTQTVTKSLQISSQTFTRLATPSTTLTTPSVNTQSLTFSYTIATSTPLTSINIQPTSVPSVIAPAKHSSLVTQLYDNNSLVTAHPTSNHVSVTSQVNYSSYELVLHSIAPSSQFAARKNRSAGIIAGGVIAGVLFIILIVVALAVLIWKVASHLNKEHFAHVLLNTGSSKGIFSMDGEDDLNKMLSHDHSEM